jgi:putative ABC transport system permease protein
MFNYHFKIAFRHARRHQSASTVQFLGLFLGLIAVFYIGLFIKSELAFDQMHEHRSELYRVLRLDAPTGTRGHATSSLHGASLKEDFPSIDMCRFGNDPVKIGNTTPILVEDFFWSDSTFFELFTFSFIHGNPATCLDEINSLVLTKSKSQQIFGTENSMGNTVKVKVYDGNKEFLMKVTGVVEDPPKQSHIQFAGLGSMANAEQLYGRLLQQWSFSWLRTYIQVPDNQIEKIEAGIPHLIKKHFGEDPPPNFGITFQAFNEVYLHSQDIPKNTFAGDIRNLRIFGGIGLLILLISLMNYVNLATARAITRSKEVGIRKILGSKKVAIMTQFMIESLLFTLVSGIVAAYSVKFFLPQLNDLFQLDLSFSVLTGFDILLVFLALMLLGLIVGILPSVAMSNLPSIGDNKLLSQLKPNQWSFSRKLFIGLQYVITLVLLVATFVIYKQYHYLKDFDKGFDANQLVNIPVEDRDVQKQLPLLKEQIGSLSGVLGVATTGENLPSELNNTWGFNWNGSGLENNLLIDIIGVDKDYFPLLDIELKAGQNFHKEYAIDSARSVILNEKALSLINKTDMIGKEVIIGGRNRDVIGVVKDYHNTSLHSKITPMAYFVFESGHRVSPDNLLVKLDTKEMTAQLEKLSTVWQQFSPDPFQYSFVDEAFADAYQTEQQFSRLISTFTLVAIFISLVGLFGLINFITQLKLREISIRRVLGANFLSLMQLLGRDFIYLFLMALVIALPIAFYFTNEWLANYAYHVQVNFGVFLLAAIICLGISVMVIFYHLKRSTRINPAEILASE